MYIFFITLSFIFVFIKYIFSIKKKVRIYFNKYDKIFIFLLLFICISIIFLLQYKPLLFISADTYRYVHEVNLFSTDIFNVNEIVGSYHAYKVTPKLGVSSFYALVKNILFIDKFTPNHFILLNLSFFVIIISTCYVILREFWIKNKINLSVFLLIMYVLMFPSDIYWLTRALREPLVNAFFLLGIISICRFFISSNYLLLGLFILIYLFEFLSRTQLALTLSVYFIILSIFLIKHILQKFTFLFFGIIASLLAISQTFVASGFRIKILNFLYSWDLYNIIWFCFMFLWALALFICFVHPKGGMESFYKNRKYKMIVLCSSTLLLSLPYIYLYLTSPITQIRFAYPAFILLKIFLFFLSILIFRKKYYPYMQYIIFLLLSVSLLFFLTSKTASLIYDTFFLQS